MQKILKPLILASLSVSCPDELQGAIQLAVGAVAHIPGIKVHGHHYVRFYASAFHNLAVKERECHLLRYIACCK